MESEKPAFARNDWATANAAGVEQLSAFDDPAPHMYRDIEHEPLAESDESPLAPAESQGASRKPNIFILGSALLLLLCTVAVAAYMAQVKFKARSARTEESLLSQGSIAPFVTASSSVSANTEGAAAAPDPLAAPSDSSSAPLASGARTVEVVANPQTTEIKNESPTNSIPVGGTPSARSGKASDPPRESRARATPAHARFGGAQRPLQPGHASTGKHKHQSSAKPNSTRLLPSIPGSTDSSEKWLLPESLRVVAVYPLSGPHAQAWLADSLGKTFIVREGDRIFQGVQVGSVNAERMEVVTTSGVVTTRGLRP